MLSIGNKTFMNLQEAVGWLLENNALPFQSTANYAGGVEIAMSTLINPSPAKVRVGSIIFFADSKVSTVVGVTSNSFIVSDQYNDLVDDVVYVANVALDASGHLIVTLSNGDTIDAGLIKQVDNFSINASQHLIANYNDGTSTDLGAIFSGNVSISGNLSVSGNITGSTSFETIKDANGNARFVDGAITTNAITGLTVTYARWALSGTHLMLVIAGNIADTSSWSQSIFAYNIPLPAWVKAKIVPTFATVVEMKDIKAYNSGDYSNQDLRFYLEKSGGGAVNITIGSFTATKDRSFRIAFDLIIDNA